MYNKQNFFIMCVLLVNVTIAIKAAKKTVKSKVSQVKNNQTQSATTLTEVANDQDDEQHNEIAASTEELQKELDAMQQESQNRNIVITAPAKDALDKFIDEILEKYNMQNNLANRIMVSLVLNIAVYAVVIPSLAGIIMITDKIILKYKSKIKNNAEKKLQQMKIKEPQNKENDFNNNDKEIVQMRGESGKFNVKQDLKNVIINLNTLNNKLGDSTFMTHTDKVSLTKTYYDPFMNEINKLKTFEGNGDVALSEIVPVCRNSLKTSYYDALLNNFFVGVNMDDQKTTWTDNNREIFRNQMREYVNFHTNLIKNISETYAADSFHPNKLSFTHYKKDAEKILKMNDQEIDMLSKVIFSKKIKDSLVKFVPSLNDAIEFVEKNNSNFMNDIFDKVDVAMQEQNKQKKNEEIDAEEQRRKNIELNGQKQKEKMQQLAEVSGLKESLIVLEPKIEEAINNYKEDESKENLDDLKGYYGILNTNLAELQKYGQDNDDTYKKFKTLSESVKVIIPAGPAAEVTEDHMENVATKEINNSLDKFGELVEQDKDNISGTTSINLQNHEQENLRTMKTYVNHVKDSGMKKDLLQKSIVHKKVINYDQVLTDHLNKLQKLANLFDQDDLKNHHKSYSLQNYKTAFQSIKTEYNNLMIIKDIPIEYEPLFQKNFNILQDITKQMITIFENAENITHSDKEALEKEFTIFKNDLKESYAKIADKPIDKEIADKIDKVKIIEPEKPKSRWEKTKNIAVKAKENVVGLFKKKKNEPVKNSNVSKVDEQAVKNNNQQVRDGLKVKVAEL